MAEVTKEYAEALFMLACEIKSEREFLSSLKKIEEVFKANTDFTEFLCAPNIPFKSKSEAIEKVFSEKHHEYIISFLLLLSQKGYLHALDECIKEYKALLSMKESLVTAKVTAAVALSEKELDSLKSSLEKKYKKQITIDFHTDSSLLGGLVVELDGKIIDGSLRHKLQDMKDVISK